MSGSFPDEGKEESSETHFVAITEICQDKEGTRRRHADATASTRDEDRGRESSCRVAAYLNQKQSLTAGSKTKSDRWFSRSPNRGGHTGRSSAFVAHTCGSG